MYLAIVDEPRTQGLPVAGHGREDELRRTARPEDGTPAAAMIAETRGNAEVVSSWDAAKAEALFARFRANGTAQCPTLVQLRKFASTGDAAFVADARLKYVPASVRQMWQARLAGPLRQILPYATKAYPKQLETVGAMQKAGVWILAGTDSGPG